MIRALTAICKAFTSHHEDLSELAGDKLAVPAQDSAWPRHPCDLGEDLSAQAMAKLSPSVARWASERLGRPFSLAIRMRFSAARYSLRASSSWTTVPVT